MSCVSAFVLVFSLDLRRENQEDQQSEQGSQQKGEKGVVLAQVLPLRVTALPLTPEKPAR